MATRRRRSFRTTTRFQRGNGRQRLWVQATLGNISLVDASNGVFAGQMVVPSDWEREDLAFTQVPSRPGGPRLEAMYLSVVSNLSDETQFAPAVPELLVYTQSSQFANIVTDNASFTATFQNQRVLMYDAQKLRGDASYMWPNNELIQAQYGVASWHLKSKVRLADTEVNVAVRHGLDVTAFSNASVQIAFRAYLSLP